MQKNLWLNNQLPRNVLKNKDVFLEKLHAYLFSSGDEQEMAFDKNEQDMVVRYRGAITKWLSEPNLRDVDIINFMVNLFEIKKSQAYYDLSRIKILIGNVQNPGKEFQRYRATEMILSGYNRAADADSHLEVKQAMAMIRAGEALAKVHMLDKNELDNVPWEDIIPIELEPTTDVSVLGRKKIDNIEELQRKMREKYGKAIDVQYTDIGNGE